MMQEDDRKLLLMIREELRVNTAKTEKILSAFPGGDTEGHCRYHMVVIERQELRNKMVREALVKMAGAGAVAGIGWLLWAVWLAIKTEVSK